MNPIWNANDLSLALNQEINFQANQPRLSSLLVTPNDFFIALQGQKDGHDYIQDALSKSAIFAIARRIPENVTEENIHKIVLVEDPYQALLQLAKYRRNQSKAKFIAITGSCGKTSTKSMLAAILGHFHSVSATYGNFNNHLGLPLTLASIDLQSQYVVTEIGMNNKGEIKPLAQMVRPDIAIVTNVMPAHIGNFIDIAQIAKEKGDIFQGPIDNAYAIIHQNKDTPELFDILKKTALNNGVKHILTFGQEPGDATLLEYQLINKHLARLKINIGAAIYEIKTKLVGKHNAYNILATILACSCFDLNIEKVISFIENYDLLDGRGKLFTVHNFGKSFEIIDDAYNANPGSIKAALSNFGNITSGQIIAILGDMLELGSGSIKYHQDLKTDVESCGLNKLITVGPLMKNLYAVVESVEKYHFPDYQELIEQLPHLINNNDLILLKSSKGANLAKVVEFIKNPTKK
jgi:UDP-N-acetylmuramoyl-tripeptide--D-alanyl-D-alanine ligase